MEYMTETEFMLVATMVAWHCAVKSGFDLKHQSWSLETLHELREKYPDQYQKMVTEALAWARGKAKQSV